MWQLPPLKPEEILDYLRKSQTDDPTMTVEETLAKHEQRLDEWMDRNLPGMGPVPEENKYREVVSGETIDSRPQFLEVLRRIESPKIKAIKCFDPQRLSRGSLKDIGRLVELLRYSNTIVITMQYNYDLRDDRDREQFERELMRGNDYLEYYKRIQQNGRLLSVSKGNYLGQHPPYGYRKIKVKEGRDECPTLEPIPEQAKIVNMIFDLYAQGIGATTICDRLNAMGIPSPAGKEWENPRIHGILTNVHYIGKVRWNYRATVKRVEDGEVRISRPRAEEYLVYEGKQDAIVTMEQWNAVQAIKGKIPRNKKNTNGFNPLAGLMFCQCGKPMSGRTFMNKGIERCAPRFLCSNQRKCGSASSTMSAVLDRVCEVLEGAIKDFELRIAQGTDDSATIHRQAVDRLVKRLQELKDLEVKQWDEKIRGTIPPHVFDKLNGDTLREIEEVQQALCTARDSIPEPVNLPEKVKTFRTALDTLQDPTAPAKEKNLLLKACIERITYSRQRQGNNGHTRKGEETPICLDFQLRV